MEKGKYEMHAMPQDQPPPPAYVGQPPPPGYQMQPPQAQPLYPQPPLQQQTLIVPQPVVMTREPEYVPDNTVLAIISVFFCCIIGIIAVMKSQKAKTNRHTGNIEQAFKDSAMAKKLAIAAIVTGCIIFFLVIFITFILPIILAGVVVSQNEAFD